jgi:hypothetical protein
MEDHKTSIGGIRNTDILIRKPEGKDRLKIKVYIKIALKEIDWEVEDSIHLAQDRYKR